MPRALVVEILGEATQFAHELDKAAGKTRRFGAAAKVAGVAIAGGLAYGLEKSVEAARKAEEATARLNTAFKTSGVSSAKYATAIEEAEKAGRKLGFTNADVKDALGSLVVATHDGGKALKDLSVAQDIARFKHTDLASASKMLTMAMAGSQRAVKQLGISVQPVTDNYDKLKATMHGHLSVQDKETLAAAKLIDKQATAAEVIDIVSKKLHGQADAFSKTATGGMEQFHAQLDNLQENIGKGLLPALNKIVVGLSDAVAFITDHWPEISKVMDNVWRQVGPILSDLKDIVVAIFDVIRDNWPTISKILEGVWSVAKPVLEALHSALKLIVDLLHGDWGKAWDDAKNVVTKLTTAIKTGLETETTAIYNLAKKIGEQIKTAILDGVGKVGDWFHDHVIQPVLDKLTGFAGEIPNFATALFKTVTDFITDAGIGTWIYNKVGEFAAFFGALPSRVAEAVRGKAKELWDGVRHIFDLLPGFVKDALGIASPSKVFASIGEAIIHGAIRGIENKAGDLQNATVAAFNSIKNAAIAGWDALVSLSPDWDKPGLPAGTGGRFGPNVAGGGGGLVSQVLNALAYARSHGWGGSVTSGFRTYAEQAALYQNYLHGGPLAAAPGTSSHESGQAVDVTDYGTFARIMASAPAGSRLYNFLGAADPVHFSVSGYAKGGIFTQPTLGVIGEAGPEAVIPLNRANRIGGPEVIQLVLDSKVVAEAVRREFNYIVKNNGSLGFT